MPPPAVLRCDCGQPWSKCVYVVQRSGARRWLYYRCIECRREWTVQEDVADLADPVSTDEVLEVHRLLDYEDGGRMLWAELLK
jgi:hypothetical protein